MNSVLKIRFKDRQQGLPGLFYSINIQKYISEKVAN